MDKNITVIDQLKQLGFSLCQAENAISNVKDISLEAALDYLTSTPMKKTETTEDLDERKNKKVLSLSAN